MRHSRLRKCGGMTLIELLVTIGIIALLAAAAIAAVANSRRLAAQSACISNLRQISVSVIQYVDEEGRFPEAANLPSLGVSNLPVISDVLTPRLGGMANVFRCPDDRQGYFQRERSSYEWNTILNGKTRNAVRQRGEAANDSDIRLLWDFEPFHGTAGDPKARNLAFFGGTVKPF